MHCAFLDASKAFDKVLRNSLFLLAFLAMLHKRTRLLTRAHHGDEISERDVTYHLTRLLIYH